MGLTKISDGRGDARTTRLTGARSARIARLMGGIGSGALALAATPCLLVIKERRTPQAGRCVGRKRLGNDLGEQTLLAYRWDRTSVAQRDD